MLNEEKTKEYIKRAFDSFQGELDLEAAGCYEDLPLTEQMQKDIALYEKIRAFQEMCIRDSADPVQSGFHDCHGIR